MQNLFLPTGVRSIEGLPSLDDMLGGGLQGNWLIAGATGIGKTTLAVSYIGNQDGINNSQPSAILDYGTRQGQERYLRDYNLEICNFNDLIRDDKERLEESRIYLEYNKRPLKNFDIDLGRGITFRDLTVKTPKLIKAQLADKCKQGIIKYDIREESRINLNSYFYTIGIKELTELQLLMSTMLYYSFRVNGARRFLIDGLTKNFEKYVQEVSFIHKYFNAELELLIPFLGDNYEELFKLKNKVFWKVEEPISTLTSLTLTRDSPGEDIEDMRDAISHTQALSISQEVEGIIVIGKNVKGRYAFQETPTIVAPHNTRLLQISKSRYGANETYREVILNQDKKPVLGRVLVPLC